MKVTSCPARARRPAKQPPVPPAPTTAMRMANLLLLLSPKSLLVVGNGGSIPEQRGPAHLYIAYFSKVLWRMGSELPRIALLILYKKGYKRPSHRGFGLYMEGEMGRKFLLVARRTTP